MGPFCHTYSYLFVFSMATLLIPLNWPVDPDWLLLGSVCPQERSADSLFPCRRWPLFREITSQVDWIPDVFKVFPGPMKNIGIFI
jgi:hypothetical protein